MALANMRIARKLALGFAVILFGFRRSRRRDLLLGGARRKDAGGQYRRAGDAGRPREARRGALRPVADGARLHHHSHRAPRQPLCGGDEAVRRNARQDARGRARLSRPRRRNRRGGEARRRGRRLAARNRRSRSRADARPDDGGTSDRSRQIGAQQRADAEVPRRAAKRARRRRRRRWRRARTAGEARARLHALRADPRLDLWRSPARRRSPGGSTGRSPSRSPE